MSFRIVADSCCDRTQQMKDWTNITFVPLTLSIDDYTILDDESFDQEDFIRRTRESKNVGKSACPAPDAFAAAMDCDEDDIYVITITDKLSGTYNSALQGKMLYEEEHSGKNIHVFNSLATSGLESLVAEKITELGNSGADFNTIVETVEDYILNHTALFFNLESFDALNKNGRLYAMAATILKKLKLKLVCERTQEGSVKLSAQEFNSARAITKLAGIVINEVKDNIQEQRVIISHVCCEEKANAVAQKLKDAGFGSVEVIRASGLNSLYAADGGLIISLTK